MTRCRRLVIQLVLCALALAVSIGIAAALIITKNQQKAAEAAAPSEAPPAQPKKKRPALPVRLRPRPPKRPKTNALPPKLPPPSVRNR